MDKLDEILLKIQILERKLDADALERKLVPYAGIDRIGSIDQKLSTIERKVTDLSHE